MKKLLWAAVALGAALAFGGANTAKADVTYTVNVVNPALAPYPGPYGTVDVQLTDSTHATITFSANTGFTFTSDGVVGVNVNATSWSVGSIGGTTIPGADTTKATVSDTGSGNGFGGTFNQTFKAFDGFTDSWSTVSFVLTDLSGTWSSAASVLTPNAAGNTVTAHVAVCGTTNADGSCNGSAGAFTTGFAVNGNVPVPNVPVPAPFVGAGLPGLIAACAGLVVFARRRRFRSL
jgi:hypothetical protein